MKFSRSFVDSLRNRVSLATVAGARVEWDRRRTRGGEYWACCPFHAEKTPSFKVDDARGFYYCFGCQATGDVFGFVQAIENVDFAESVRLLAARAGVAIPTPSKAEQAREAESDRLLAANSVASHFYRSRLRSREGAEALDYLRRERGLSTTTIDSFGIGFAPDARDRLRRQLESAGVAERDAVTAGLLQAPEHGTPRDFFRNRVMFPLTLPTGACVALGGRLLGDGQPKYLNTRETPVFHKGRTLYHLGPARRAARQSGRLVVVEGYMDVIGLSEHGIEDVVAPLGTALGEEHLAMLWKSTGRIILALDGDEAGQRAAGRVIDLALPLLQPGQELRFALLPRGVDPDDHVRAVGAEGMESLLTASLPLAEMIWRREFSGHVARSPEAVAQADARLHRLAARIRHAGLQHHFRDEFRTRIRHWQQRRRAGEAAEPLPVRQATRSSVLTSPRRRDGDYRRRARAGAILLAALRHPEVLHECGEALGSLRFERPDLDRLREETLSAFLEDRLDDRTRDGLVRRLRHACRHQPHVAVERCTAPGAAASVVRDGIATLIAEHRDEQASGESVRAALDALTAAEPDPGAAERIRAAAAERARRLEVRDDAAGGGAGAGRALLRLAENPPWRRTATRPEGK